MVLLKTGLSLPEGAAERETYEKMGFHEGWGIAADQLEKLAQSL